MNRDRDRRDGGMNRDRDGGRNYGRDGPPRRDHNSGNEMRDMREREPRESREPREPMRRDMPKLSENTGPVR